MKREVEVFSKAFFHSKNSEKSKAYLPVASYVNSLRQAAPSPESLKSYHAPCSGCPKTNMDGQA